MRSPANPVPRTPQIDRIIPTNDRQPLCDVDDDYRVIAFDERLSVWLVPPYRVCYPRHECDLECKIDDQIWSENCQI